MSDPFDTTTPRPRPEPGTHPNLSQAREDVRTGTAEASADLRKAGEDLRTGAQQARQAAGEAASTVAAEASAAAETLKQEGAALLDTARTRAEDMAQQGVRAGAEHATGVARAIHRAADELQKESPELARTVHDAAGAIDRMARALRDRSPGDMLRGAEDMARRQPLAFFGAAALAGFALARFARASASHRQGMQTHGTYPAGTRDTMHDMRTAGTGATGTVSGTSMPGQGPIGSGYPQAPTGSAAGAPGWVAEDGGPPRPATLASASLGGAVSYRPRGGTENG